MSEVAVLGADRGRMHLTLLLRQREATVRLHADRPANEMGLGLVWWNGGASLMIEKTSPVASDAGAGHGSHKTVLARFRLDKQRPVVPRVWSELDRRRTVSFMSHINVG